MASCNKTRFPQNKICGSDLRLNIIIAFRDYTVSQTSSGQSSGEFTTILQANAACQTSNRFNWVPRQRGNTAYLNDVPSHTFIIRYNESILTLHTDKEYYVLYDGIAYAILSIQQQDLARYYINIYTVKRGDETLAANMS